jgi:hypothetical protein
MSCGWPNNNSPATDKLRAAGDDGESALVQDGRLPRNGGSPYRSQASRRDTNELSIGQVGYIAVVSKERKISASGNVLCVLLFLNTVCGDANDMIMLQRKLHGLIERNSGADQVIWFAARRTAQRKLTKTERKTVPRVSS